LFSIFFFNKFEYNDPDQAAFENDPFMKLFDQDKDLLGYY